MTALLPYPLLSASLLAMWLLLNQSLALGHVILGCVLAVIGGWILKPLALPDGGARKPLRIAELLVVVLMDILRSNIAVGRIVLGERRRHVTSGFIDIPLDLRNPFGLAVLACIITATPGTLWVGFSPERGVLTIHVLDLIDENAWIETIKGRYERRLLEIFG